MTEALLRAIRIAFDELEFHRIEATYQVENHASAAVLEKLGFFQVGLYPGYNFIGGAWRDNMLMVLERMANTLVEHEGDTILFAWLPDAAFVLRAYFEPFYLKEFVAKVGKKML